MKLFDNVEKSAEDYPSFIDRLLTAILAPIAFGFPVFIIIALLSGAGIRIIRRNRLFDQVPIDLILLIIVVIPVITGFALGISRFTVLYGHLFYTNIGYEKDIRKTIAAWLCLFLIAFGVSSVLG
ncbi:hypothetical protein [Methylotenera sp. L2L1]|uniref:hypothetical protein n=1 Tax=Methylotenera sp. L2L1 TaxID=1502770 RepID=UPI0005677D4D|nr:hypothetical protein [Methylotenera sp. L2L1]